MTPAEYIAGWEGYSGVAYWDVNHWRIGFGSDTEGPDGIEVVQGMTTTKPRALANLSIRVKQFQNIAAKSMGIETWASLNEAQRTALTSLVYNYGRLPIKVYTSDPEKTAAAIAARATDNGGVNRKRRQGEAAYYLTGTHEKKPDHTPVVVGTTMTGGAAVVTAMMTWFMQISGMDRILVSIVILEAFLIFWLAKRLMAKQPDVIIHPVPEAQELEVITRFRQAKAKQDALALTVAEAAKEVDNARLEVSKTVETLQSEIT